MKRIKQPAVTKLGITDRLNTATSSSAVIKEMLTSALMSDEVTFNKSYYGQRRHRPTTQGNYLSQGSRMIQSLETTSGFRKPSTEETTRNLVVEHNFQAKTNLDPIGEDVKHAGASIQDADDVISKVTAAEVGKEDNQVAFPSGQHKKESMLPSAHKTALQRRDKDNKQRPTTMEGTGRRRRNLAAFNTICSGGYNRRQAHPCQTSHRSSDISSQFETVFSPQMKFQNRVYQLLNTPAAGKADPKYPLPADESDPEDLIEIKELQGESPRAHGLAPREEQGLKYLNSQVNNFKQDASKKVDQLYKNQSTGCGVVLVDRPRTREIARFKRMAQSGYQSASASRDASIMQQRFGVRKDPNAGQVADQDDDQLDESARSDRQARVQDYMHRLETMRQIAIREKREREEAKRAARKAKARQNIDGVFDAAYRSVLLGRLRPNRYQAAIRIQRWWRDKLVDIREYELRRWLPADIDLEAADYGTVQKLLNALDDYSFRKMALEDGVPTLPQIIKIQRFMRSYLRQTRLRRFIYRIIKIVKMVGALDRFRTRGLQQLPFRKSIVEQNYDKEVAEKQEQTEREMEEFRLENEQLQIKNKEKTRAEKKAAKTGNTDCWQQPTLQKTMTGPSKLKKNFSMSKRASKVMKFADSKTKDAEKEPPTPTVAPIVEKRQSMAAVLKKVRSSIPAAAVKAPKVNKSLKAKAAEQLQPLATTIPKYIEFNQPITNTNASPKFMDNLGTFSQSFEDNESFMENKTPNGNEIFHPTIIKIVSQKYQKPEVKRTNTLKEITMKTKPRKERPCCEEYKEQWEHAYAGWEGHMQPEWRLEWSDKWRNPKPINIPNHHAKHSTQKSLEPEAPMLKEMRKKQFFLFFSDFFTKFESYNKQMRKQGLTNDKEYFNFDNQQKTQLLRSYFKKYFRNDARKLPSKIVKYKIEDNLINTQRECSCAQNKARTKSKNQKEKFIDVEMVVEQAAIENRETFLGNSQGVQNVFCQHQMEKELDELISRKKEQFFGKSAQCGDVLASRKQATCRSDSPRSPTSARSPGRSPNRSQNSSPRSPRKRGEGDVPISSRTNLEQQLLQSTSDLNREQEDNNTLDILKKYMKGNKRDEVPEDKSDELVVKKVKSSFAPELLKNCIEQQQEVINMEKMQRAAQKYSKTETFGHQFPEFNNILQMYSKSRIFSPQVCNQQSVAADSQASARELKEQEFALLEQGGPLTVRSLMGTIQPYPAKKAPTAKWNQISIPPRREAREPATQATQASAIIRHASEDMQRWGMVTNMSDKNLHYDDEILLQQAIDKGHNHN